MRANWLAMALICASVPFGCDSSSEEPSGVPADGGGSGGSTAGGAAGSVGVGGSAGAGGSAGSGGSSGSGGSARDGSADSAGSLDGSADAPFDAASVNCSTNPPAWPVFDRTCWDDLWCSVALHQVNCCGTVIATGILHPEVEKFDLAEAVCRQQIGFCDCLAGPTKTDTGQVTNDAAQIKVACRSNVCTTYVP